MGLGGETRASKTAGTTARLRTGEKEPVMTLKPELTERTRKVGHISHAAQLRVDQRVQKILARRVALDRARRAAQHVR